MPEAIEIWEQPQADEIYMIAGWRQWADAGSISSGLPQYLIDQTKAHKIGTLHSDGFYIFQFPGTHDLVRPVVKFKEGFPESLETPRNEIFYAGDDERGVVFFLGDEPHLDVARYVTEFLQIAQILGVKRIIGLGGVYGELPYDKERYVSCIYSQLAIKSEIEQLSVDLSDYHGGASIGSYICRVAGDQDMDFVSFYGFVPTYEFSDIAEIGNTIRIENDYMAWYGIMRRVNYLLKIEIDLSDLEKKSKKLIRLVDAKVDELDKVAPQLGLRDYLFRLSENFAETSFDPLDDVWEEEFRRLFDDDSD